MIKIGRFYDGDIDGKFWFGVQASDDADNFGVKGEHPPGLDYYFGKDDLPKIQEGIDLCEKNLGDYKIILDKFFEQVITYNDNDLVESLKVNVQTVKFLLTNYARLGLGIQIKECVIKTGECSFHAEE